MSQTSRVHHPDGDAVDSYGHESPCECEQGVRYFASLSAHAGQAWISESAPSLSELRGSPRLGRWNAAEHDLQDQAPASIPVAYRWTADPVDARYLRVRVSNRAIIPAGQPAAGSAAWIFADELIVNPRP